MNFDTTQLLEQTMNSKISTMMYNQLIANSRPNVGNPQSTDRAFTGTLRLDSRVAVQGAKNMEDAAAMVSIAQTGVTAIKSKLDEMKQIAIEASTRDDLSADDYAAMQDNLQKLATELTDIAKTTNFNGMSLLDGTAGMNSDGVIQLQAGKTSRNQALTNFVDDDVTAGQVLNGSKINLKNMRAEMNLTNTTQIENTLNTINSVYDRVYSVESQYSYDIKSLNNLSTLLKGQADILNAAQKNHVTTPKQTQESVLMDLLSGSGGSIFSSQG